MTSVVLAIVCAFAVLEPVFGAELAFQRASAARFRFDGFVGERIGACVTNWLIPAPESNPGMLEMFRARDKKPVPNLVPWAGEFVGKYLISAIQMERLNHPELRPLIERVIREFMATQSEDGYLGPFPQEDRLLKHWDLWGHYHCMQALLLWHEQTGDTTALSCATRAADLICKTYLGAGRQMIEAGSDEMNLSVIHVFGSLFRLTKSERYLRMMREIEKDWARGGDFVSKAEQGVEFFECPRPRWESLHSLQGLLELYRITGEQRYRNAFEHWWRSIARWDVRNTGGFSSGEQATGDPYAPTAIETCCSIAWMALTVDMLQLSGRADAADALELATLNAWAGAQHPSGRWCTYNTPMDGVREASAHTIVFQSRAGTPELNCCSVNGPRGWGMLVDWALMKTSDGLVLNWYGPGEFQATTPSGEPVTISVTGNYPASEEVQVRIATPSSLEFGLSFRIPGWTEKPELKIDGESLRPAPGAYVARHKQWKDSTVTLRLPMPIRLQAGARAARGKVSFYRGPLLLAWDQRFDDRLPEAVRLADLTRGTISLGATPPLSPLIRFSLPAGPELVDFASAGATGTRYASWLAATNLPPAPVVTRFPRDGATVPPGRALFRWTTSENAAQQVLQFSRGPDFESFRDIPVTNTSTLLNMPESLPRNRWIYWRVLARNNFGEARPSGPVACFRVDPALPARDESLPQHLPAGASGEIVRATLAGSPAPEIGSWSRSANWKAVENGAAVALNGRDERLLYSVGEWPEEAYSVSLRFRIDSLPEGRLAQVFSAWCAPSDDPLRLTVEDGRLFARIEAGAAYSTPGARVTPGTWHHVAAVRTGGRLTLYLDATEQGSVAVPLFTSTRAADFAIGGNPHYSGNEFLELTVANLTFFGRALSSEEIRGASN